MGGSPSSGPPRPLARGTDGCDLRHSPRGLDPGRGSHPQSGNGTRGDPSAVHPVRMIRENPLGTDGPGVLTMGKLQRELRTGGPPAVIPFEVLVAGRSSGARKPQVGPVEGRTPPPSSAGGGESARNDSMVPPGATRSTVVFVDSSGDRRRKWCVVGGLSAVLLVLGLGVLAVALSSAGHLPVPAFLEPAGKSHVSGVVVAVPVDAVDPASPATDSGVGPNGQPTAGPTARTAPALGQPTVPTSAGPPAGSGLAALPTGSGTDSVSGSAGGTSSPGRSPTAKTLPPAASKTHPAPSPGRARPSPTAS